MKPKNFPARKLLRQLNAKRVLFTTFSESDWARLDAARAIRTKKRRSNVD